VPALEHIGAVVVEVDEVNSTDTITFTSFASAGTFAIESPTIGLHVDEIMGEAVQSDSILVRRTGSSLASRAVLTVAIEEDTPFVADSASAPLYFVSEMKNLTFEAGQTVASFTANITAGQRISGYGHVGADDDRFARIRLVSYSADFGPENPIAEDTASVQRLKIHGLCTTITHQCKQFIQNDAVYYIRADRLPDHWGGTGSVDENFWMADRAHMEFLYENNRTILPIPI
jgi:hypothetical protein